MRRLGHVERSSAAVGSGSDPREEPTRVNPGQRRREGDHDPRDEAWNICEEERRSSPQPLNAEARNRGRGEATQEENRGNERLLVRVDLPSPAHFGVHARERGGGPGPGGAESERTKIT